MVARPAVLIVDDDEAIVELLMAALEYRGYRALSAIGSAALDLARDIQPKVILLDLQMPAMDGAEISRRLRADPHTAHIPIVVMSAHDNLGSTAVQMPVNDWLAKPFGLNHLYEVMSRWMAA